MRVEAESHKRVRPLEPDAVSTAEGRNQREAVSSLHGVERSFFFKSAQTG